MTSNEEEMNAFLKAYEAAFYERNRDTQRHFNYDGIVSNQHWNTAPKKILFLLKETNKANQDLREAIVRTSKQAKTKTRTGWHKSSVLRTVGRWAHGLMHYSGGIPDYNEAKKEQFQAPLSIAYVNLRKSAGGPKTNAKDLAKDVRLYADFIKQQISLIQPEIVVLCGTYRVTKHILYPDMKNISERIHELGDMKLINAHHPAQRNLTDIQLYEQVLSCYHKYASGVAS